MSKTRPFLKWAGGKYNCLERILSSLPPGNRLIEPFTGSGVVFMNTQYKSYLLAESNPDLIQIFNILKAQGEAFITYCQQYFNSEANSAEFYYQTREGFNHMVDSDQKSAYFLYLNRHGYNGLCRYNSQGKYNVPFGLYIRPPYFPRDEMLLFHQKSTNATFIQNDFRETFKLAKPGDVIYCDPPYVPISEKSKPIAYTKSRFSQDDQIELAQLAKTTAAKGIPVIISNHDTEFTRHHYENAKITSFFVSRFINSNIHNRVPVKELLAVFS